jgi:3-deoxy-D-manno-octulosonic-acid transferase
VLRSRHPGLQLVIVPRKPERFDEVADLIRRGGYECVRRSERPDGGTGCQPAHTGKMPVPHPQGQALAAEVFLGDTMGELRKFYSLASVVFVGRSIVAMGGSDAMEVAALAKPTVVGPHNENFADIVSRLQQGGGIHILKGELDDGKVADELADTMGKLLEDPAAAAEMGRRGREVVLANRGATQRTLDRLMEMLNRAQHCAS